MCVATVSRAGAALCCVVGCVAVWKWFVSGGDWEDSTIVSRLTTSCEVLPDWAGVWPNLATHLVVFFWG